MLAQVHGKCSHGKQVHSRCMVSEVGVHCICICTASALYMQADRGDKATNFWQKQKLRGTLAAAQLLEAMHQVSSP